MMAIERAWQVQQYTQRRFADILPWWGDPLLWVGYHSQGRATEQVALMRIYARAHAVAEGRRFVAYLTAFEQQVYLLDQWLPLRFSGQRVRFIAHKLNVPLQRVVDTLEIIDEVIVQRGLYVAAKAAQSNSVEVASDIA